MKPTISIALITLGLTFPAPALAQQHSLVFEDGSAITCVREPYLDQTSCQHETVEERTIGLKSRVKSYDNISRCHDLYVQLDPRPGFEASNAWWDECMGR